MENSIVQELAKGDKMRFEALRDIGFYPKNQIVKTDLNYQSTINRGLQLNALKSVDILLGSILEEQKTLDYYDLIMLDLPSILENGTPRINSFFRLEGMEQGDSDNEET